MRVFPWRQLTSGCSSVRRESHGARGKLAPRGAQVLDHRVAIECVARDDLASLVEIDALPRRCAEDLGPD
jgi:hypothetical protein